MKPFEALFLLAICMFSSGTAFADANVCEREMVGASARYDVPLGVLYAVGMTESGRKDSLQPNAMNIEGKAYFATDLADALAHVAEAQQSGIKMIDIGCMQINHYFHNAEFSSLSQMFDPHANVDYAARFLKQLR